MAAAAAAGEEDASALVIDEAYEFSAPRFYDFISGETPEDAEKAELWFESGGGYAPSPLMPRIKASRFTKLESMCDFTEGEEVQKGQDSMSSSMASSQTPSETGLVPTEQTRPQTEPEPVQLQEEMTDHLVVKEPELAACDTQPVVPEKPSSLKGACTPLPPKATSQKAVQQSDAKKLQTAKKIASIIRNPSALKSKTQSQMKSINPVSARRNTNMKMTSETPNFVQENQAIKRQKLEGGKSRQILNIKPLNLPHKSRPGIPSSNIKTHPHTATSCRENRKIYVREPVAPFVSMAEMMNKFQSNTRDMSLPPKSCAMSQDGVAGSVQRKPKLTLTRPKEPEFETSHRYRPVKLKSSAELEEEMMANIPKFKARPFNKKMFEAPCLPECPKTAPQLPEFKEFRLETMARANQNAETSTVASAELNQCREAKPPNFKVPKSPVLQTSMRARPTKLKPSEELEIEKLEKLPKFKARPLNKKIFESKGDIGVFCNSKRQVTVPEVFHFATDDRIPPTPANVADLFDKMSLNSGPHDDKYVPRNTMPNPFHLHTEERGAEKERRLFEELLNKRIEEERARVPKANPYPYTTDYPVIPPKPDPKQCTRPEPFPLVSLVRHEHEIQREMEERQRLEKEEAMMRIFKAQPILKDNDCRDPIPVPEKTRKPLTQIQEFNLHVEHRAVDRAKFDEKIKEKEVMYKRYRDEADSARMMEEEKALKQLRRTLVPHARPVPKFHQPFQPQKSSKQVTRPKSPKLEVLKRKDIRKFHPKTSSATSSAASNMR